ncbi:MAG: hypothetical protein A3H42_00855 [Deltaproteobacteria bacterium RIFCSPLOWO2_02_FULL_46_8]|nr:MAG: hypothetical protein A3H42_00855 [Deltaproteobacteria bacterium RIFCSPLOWO2_02_FULL_46_8]
MKLAQGHFHKSLNLFDATNLVIGVMIGSGIFIVSADVARQVASPGWFLLTWVLAGILTVMVSLIYGELAALFPHAGGQYIYLKEAYNPLFGFLYGWTLFTVIQTGSIAAVGVAFAKFSGVLFPAISQKTLAVAAVLFLTFVNCHSLKVGKRIQNIFTVIKVLSLLLLVAAGFFWIHSGSAGFGEIAQISSWWTTPPDILLLIGVALVGPFFAFDAWNNITFTGDEIKEAPKTLPRALAFGSLIVTILYLLVNLSYLNLLPFDAIQNASGDRVATAAILQVLGPVGEGVMAMAIMISTFGCLNGMILMGARLYWAMSQDGLFFKAAGRLGVKNGVPQAGLILQGIWSVVLTLSGTYGDLLDYVIFASVLSYVLTVVGLFRLRKKMPDTVHSYRTPFYPILPLLYVLLGTFFLVILLWKKPMYTWPGFIIVLSGIPVYYFWRWWGNRRREKH